MRVAIATAFALIVVSANANGQNARIDALSLQSGVRAIVLATTAGSRYEHVAVAPANPGSLRSSLDRSFAANSLASQQVGKTDASPGSHNHVWRGAGIGLLVGAIGGVAYGRTANPGSMGRGYNEAVGAVGFGAIGAVSGALIGLAWRSEN
jgi:hypothetical protein